MRAAPPFHTLGQPLPTFIIALAAVPGNTRAADVLCVLGSALVGQVDVEADREIDLSSVMCEGLKAVVH